MPRGPQPGEPAPDFELDGTDGAFRLSDHRGEQVVLLFYPGDNTPVCTRQFCSYRDHGEDVDALDAVVVGISAQDLGSHEEFVAKHGLNVPLLADVEGEVARLYGAHGRITGTKRAVVIVDGDGIVRHRHDHRLGLDYLDVDQLRDALGPPGTERSPATRPSARAAQSAG
jgi:peroxiredoxin Q/BCP